MFGNSGECAEFTIVSLSARVQKRNQRLTEKITWILLIPWRLCGDEIFGNHNRFVGHYGVAALANLGHSISGQTVGYWTLRLLI